MHDPLVVAFAIRRPWPRRMRSLDAKPGERRWRLGPTARFAGRALYFPCWITVWHREPGGRDSGEVCRHYRRWHDGQRWQTKILNGWRWHVWHWKIQVGPLQDLRRALLTRCGWCGGRNTKTDPINVSNGWHRPRARWWQGEKDLFHHGCSLAEVAHRACTCAAPDLGTRAGLGYGTCTTCGLFIAYSRTWKQVAHHRVLKTVPQGTRPTPEVLQKLKALTTVVPVMAAPAGADRDNPESWTVIGWTTPEGLRLTEKEDE